MADETEAREKSGIFDSVWKLKPIRMLIVGLLMAASMILLLELTFALDPGMRTNYKIYNPNQFLGELGKDLWMACISIPLYSLIPIAWFFSIPTYTLAGLTNRIWKPRRKIEFLYVAGTFAIGISLLILYWHLNGFFDLAITCFALSPLSNLSLALAAVVFFGGLAKKKIQEAPNLKKIKIATRSRPWKNRTMKIAKMLFFGLLIGILAVAGFEAMFRIDPKTIGWFAEQMWISPGTGKEWTYYRGGPEYILFPYAWIYIFPLLILHALPFYAFAILTKKIWKPKSRRDFYYVAAALYVGTLILAIYWAAMDFNPQALLCFIILPIMNLSLPLSWFIFDYHCRLNELAKYKSTPQKI
jgi:hypothetical protein